MCIQLVIITHLPPSVSGASEKAPTRPVTPEQEFSWNNQNGGGHGKVRVSLQKSAIFCRWMLYLVQLGVSPLAVVSVSRFQ